MMCSTYGYYVETLPLKVKWAEEIKFSRVVEIISIFEEIDTVSVVVGGAILRIQKIW